MPREYTNKLLEMLENGLLGYKTITLECLNYMSEDDIRDLMHCAGLIDEETDEENDEDDD